MPQVFHAGRPCQITVRRTIPFHFVVHADPRLELSWAVAAVRRSQVQPDKDREQDRETQPFTMIVNVCGGGQAEDHFMRVRIKHGDEDPRNLHSWLGVSFI